MVCDRPEALDEPRPHLSNFCLLPGGGAPKIVEADVEPAVDVGMDGIVLVTNLLAGQALLQRLQAAASGEP